MADADLLLIVLDGSGNPKPEEVEILELTSGNLRVVALNKSDLPTFGNQFSDSPNGNLRVVEV